MIHCPSRQVVRQIVGYRVPGYRISPVINLGLVIKFLRIELSNWIEYRTVAYCSATVLDYSTSIQ